MKNGIILCYESSYVGRYRYIDGGDERIRIEKSSGAFLIYFGNEKIVKLPIRKNGAEMLIMIISDNTPKKTVEFSSDGKSTFYEEREPSFEDHLLSNFVKEELIRGNITKESFLFKRENHFYIY